ncbi:MAG: amidohydrolase [Clostridiales bacterium]|nr:amidohydrolase [Clostridiales bacterium]
MNIIQKRLINIQDDIIKYRRELHKIPEKGFEEYKTQEYIMNFLENMNVEYEKVAKTGIIAIIKGIDQTKAVAYRTDIDGLGVTEENTIEYVSIHNGMMHACGHDGHMAITLGTIKYLMENNVVLKENLVFIFQPAEEGPGGAEKIIAEGIFEKYNIREIFGYHVFPEVKENFFSAESGPIMARTGEFDIEIYSKSAHGAMPHKGVDAALLASELLVKFQSIISRSIDPMEPAVLTVGRMEAGERRNVIAGYARLEGTIRAFNEEVYKQIKETMNNYAKHLENKSVELNIIFRDMYPEVNNSTELVKSFENAVGKERISNLKPQMIAEQFSYRQKVVPGIFVFLGINSVEKGFESPLHSSTFNFDEKMLLNGIEAYLRFLAIRGVIDGE